MGKAIFELRTVTIIPYVLVSQGLSLPTDIDFETKRHFSLVHFGQRMLLVSKYNGSICV